MEQYLMDYWQYFLVAFYILEKLVKLSPSKMDDILVDGLKALAMKIAKKK